MHLVSCPPRQSAHERCQSGSALISASMLALSPDDQVLNCFLALFLICLVSTPTIIGLARTLNWLIQLAVFA